MWGKKSRATKRTETHDFSQRRPLRQGTERKVQGEGEKIEIGEVDYVAGHISK